jgi:hypothetical protein
VPNPPPAPSSALAEAQAEQLLAELRALDTPDLLALCLRFRRSPERLGLYLTLFRSRPGARAQFAASLVCFDLARQGNPVAQRELAVLAPTMAVIAADEQLVKSLVSGDRYLEELWEACREALASDDPRQLWCEPGLEATELVAELDLLEDEDLDISIDFEPPAEPSPAVDQEDERTARQRQQFAEALMRHLGHEPEKGLFDYGYGFTTARGADVERLESFVRSLDAYDAVAPARGMVSLGRLFLGAHLRRLTFFGRPNPRRQAMVRDGLAMLPDLEAAASAAAIFEFEGPRVHESFEKVIELMLDYLSFCAAERLDPRARRSAERYAASNRQPTPLSCAKRRRRF